MEHEALVILSGGQDSTTCLGKAKQEFNGVHALTFDYGQRHSIEIEKSKQIAEKVGVKSHEIISLGDEILKGTSPLISNNELGKYNSAEELPDGVEPTFVAGRNILFLTIAANRAHVLDIKNILTIVECNDIEMIAIHQRYVEESTQEGNRSSIDRRMGYISSVKDAKKMLEQLYKKDIQKES